MIPHLLWRCPVCATNDSLVHTTRWLRPDRLDCTHCHAHWQVRRVVGDNFYLRLTSTKPPVEQSITAWYDDLKKTLSLRVIYNPQVILNFEEDLLLASQPAEYWTAVSPTSNAREAEDLGTLLSTGRLFLTNQRLLWRGDSHSEEFALHTVDSVQAILTLGIVVNSGRRLMFFRFLYESPLKWVTYLAMISPHIEAMTGHKLVTSHF